MRMANDTGDRPSLHPSREATSTLDQPNLGSAVMRRNREERQRDTERERTQSASGAVDAAAP